MQTLFLENIALIFAGDAYALAAGLGRIAVKLTRKLVFAPIERIARASDVAGVLVNYRKRQQARKRRCLFSFSYLKHLT